MTKIIAILCDHCKRHMGEFVWKPGDEMDTKDTCEICIERGKGRW